MTFNHLRMTPKRQIIGFVPIANIYFNRWVCSVGKDFPRYVHLRQSALP